MIDVEVFIIGARRGPESWRGFKTCRFKVLPRTGETVTTSDGWSYWVHQVDHTDDGTIALIVNTTPPKGR